MIPVIFIHSGFQDYLKYTLLQSCKNNKVILIGTHDYVKHKNLTFYNIEDYTSYCSEFVNVYEHKSSGGYDYELFCFLRWFILKKFIETHNLETIFYVDSDVMLYVDVNDEYHKYSQYDLTLLHRTAAVSSFFTKQGLNNFCDFVLNTYKNKEEYNYKKISSHYDVLKSCNKEGGVCDMTYFDFFHYYDEGGGPGKVGEMMSIIDNSTYDHNINVPDQYFDFNIIKTIEMIDNIPHVYSHKLKRKIKFNSLHFQGGAKHFISKYFTNE